MHIQYVPTSPLPIESWNYFGPDGMVSKDLKVVCSPLAVLFTVLDIYYWIIQMSCANPYHVPVASSTHSILSYSLPIRKCRYVTYELAIYFSDDMEEIKWKAQWPESFQLRGRSPSHESTTFARDGHGGFAWLRSGEQGKDEERVAYNFLPPISN